MINRIIERCAIHCDTSDTTNERTRSSRVVVDHTRSRAVRYYATQLVCECASVCSSRRDIHILQVQTLNICSEDIEQRSVQALDSETISVEGVLHWSAISSLTYSVPSERSPLLATHINVCYQQNILCENALASSYIRSKRLQRCYIANNHNAGIWRVRDILRKGTHLAYSQRLLLASLNGCVHHATLSVVQGYIQLVVLASRNCYVDVCSLAREVNTLAKRVVDNRLRSLGSRNLARLKVECERTSDRGAVDSRNLSVSQLSQTYNANL